MKVERILVIEDDKYQAGDIERQLGELGSVKCIFTELEFQKQLKSAALASYKVAVVDMMLRWTDPSPDMEMPPPEIMAEGFFTAGLRCCRALREWGIHCVIFTALDPSEIPLRSQEEFQIINKSRGYEALTNCVNSLLFTDAD